MSCNHRYLWHCTYASHGHSHRAVSRATRSISLDLVVVYPSQFEAFYGARSMDSERDQDRSEHNQ